MAHQIRTVLAHYSVSRVIPDRWRDDAEDEPAAGVTALRMIGGMSIIRRGCASAQLQQRHTKPEGVLGIGGSVARAHPRDRAHRHLR